MMTTSKLERVFSACFAKSEQTRLVFGHDEPIYLPTINGHLAVVGARHDYLSSSLHEVAHWCVAGKARRALVDYGYWYEEDGRNSEQQLQFQQVEIKPQAIEWHFSIAAGIKFQPSSDNLMGESAPDSYFRDKIAQQARVYCIQALPSRAQVFVNGLLELGFGEPPTIKHFMP